MTKKCFYCNDVLTEADFLLDKAAMIMPQTYAHVGCIDGSGDGSIASRKCHYCGKPVSDSELVGDKAVKIGRNRYAHTDCIDSHRKENTMNDQAQGILSAADYAHQSIGLARELLQESLGNTGQILTCGCMDLGAASLDRAMRLGQKLKEFSFLLADLLKEAHGLCILLGKDLGTCEGEAVILSDPHKNPGVFVHGLFRGPPQDDEEFPPGEEEFDDDEQPF